MEKPVILTRSQMRRAEENAVAAGISLETLMENAGRAAAEILCARHGTARHGLILCGKGNNGGDALVAARLLAERGIACDIALLLGEVLSPLAENNRRRLRGLSGVRFAPVDRLPWDKFDFVIDGVFGTGFSGSLKNEIAAVLRRANRAPVFRLASDIPSGMNADTGEADPDTFRADLTVAFGAYKPAHVKPEAQEFCGETVVADIGIPPLPV